MRFYSFIIIIFLIINRFAFSDFYFADTAKEFGTNEAINNINSFFQMQGTNIINQRGVTSSSIIFEPPYKSHPFRYTEVTFILSSFLSYTYASFLVFGLDALEHTFVQPSTTGRARYKSLWISATIFEVTAGVIFGAAVAYDSYQRIFGKKKEGMSFNFVPYYEPINKDAGFMFSLSYPLTR